MQASFCRWSGGSGDRRSGGEPAIGLCVPQGLGETFIAVSAIGQLFGVVLAPAPPGSFRKQLLWCLAAQVTFTNRFLR